MIWLVICLSLFVRSCVLVISIVSFMGILTLRSLMSSVSSLCLFLNFSFIRSLAKVFELLVVYWLSSCRCLFSTMFNFSTVLYVGTCLLLIAGLMGMLCVVLVIEQRQEERKNIQQIARHNNLPSYLQIRLMQRIQQKATQPQPLPATTGTDTHWATFTYSSPQIRKFTNLFKHTNVKIAFKCNNTVSQLTKPVTKSPALTPTTGAESIH